MLARGDRSLNELEYIQSIREAQVCAWINRNLASSFEGASVISLGYRKSLAYSKTIETPDAARPAYVLRFHILIQHRDLGGAAAEE